MAKTDLKDPDYILELRDRLIERSRRFAHQAVRKMILLYASLIILAIGVALVCLGIFGERNDTDNEHFLPIGLFVLALGVFIWCLWVTIAIS